MNIDNKNIDYLEKLANITLSEQQRALFSAQLDEILEYAAVVMKSSDAAQPLEHPQGLTNVMRDDMTEESLPRDIITASAPESRDGCFTVPDTFLK